MRQTVIKRAAAVLCAAAMLSACGGSDAPETHTGQTGTITTAAQTEAAETSPTAAAIFEELNKSGLCAEMDSTVLLGTDTFSGACSKLYGIEPSELTDGGVMFVGAGTSADEVSVLAGGEGLGELLKKRAEIRAGDFAGYAPEEQKKAQNAIVFTHKGLAVLVISDSAEEIKKAILSM